MARVSMRIFVLLCVVAAVGFAQNVNGSMTGRVIDQQGAAISGASVNATDPAKKITVTTKTNETGDFSLPGLQPGTYVLTVQAAGFKKLDRTNIPLNANDKLSLGDLTLEVGALTETVEVSAQAVALQTDSVERSAESFPSRWKTLR